MKHERDHEEEIPPAEARKRAQAIRKAIGYDQLSELHESLPTTAAAKKTIGTRSLFDVAVNHVIFDMVMEDPNLRPTANRGVLLEQVQTGLEKYLKDEAYRNKYAHMAR